MPGARKVCILGMGPSAIERRWDIARYVAGCEVWTLNNAYTVFRHALPVVTRWYELHAWEYLKTWDAGVPDHFRELDGLGLPVWTVEKLPAIRQQERLDVQAMFEHFAFGPGKGSNYFLGSPSLMLAHALWEHDNGATIGEVISYGIDTSDPRHGQQRASWAYWCAQAHARGITLGGTAFTFAGETEIDAGLAGLRERIGERLMAVDRTPPGPLTVAFVASPAARYRDGAKRLELQARALGLGVQYAEIGDMPEKEMERHWFAAMRAALDRGEPVLAIGADDEIIARPRIAAGAWDIATIANPEAKIIKTHLRLAPFFVVNATPGGRQFLDMMETMASLGMNGHRILEAVCTLLHGRVRIVDATEQFRGCVKMNEGGHGQRPGVCTT